MSDKIYHSGLPTPCLLVDRGKLQRNANAMTARAEEFDFALRPHVKTTKCAEIARIAHGGSSGPITVSTLHEADYFLGRGFNDITYAVCITPNKFGAAAELVSRGAKLKLLLADAGIAQALATFTEAQACSFDVMLEIDSGEHRTGFVPADDAFIETATIVDAAQNLRVAGLLTHGGHSYGCRSVSEIVDVAEQERESLLQAKRRLANAGLEAGLISSGSTPTAVLGANFDGIDEMRPGVYLVGDLCQWQLGTCSRDDIAIAVLATVIAHDPSRNQLVIDAGALALSKDRSTATMPVDFGYGLVVAADGTALRGDPTVQGVHQEHGEVTAPTPLPFDSLPIGSTVRVLPNHACMTAAAYDRYLVVDASEQVVDEWLKTAGW
ncbi:MAG: hypothetical protein HKN49_03935 [Gammaproteobacteria bacterium]|nr:hypothetical protein [Gammaproteobacteria bacterium]